MKSKSASPALRSQPERGFALVVALSLLALILLLIVSLSTIIQVETEQSEISSDQLAARQMALTALQVALGDLQRFAGPDQRVTANADLANEGIDTHKRFFTGVYDSTSGELLTYLASGMVRRAPGDAPEKLFNDFQPRIDEGGGAGDPDQVILVGEGTIGAGSGLQGPLHENYIAVPRTRVSGIGEYGYWIGDENVKARINLPTGVDEERVSAADDPLRQFSLIAPRGTGSGLIEGFDGFLANDERLKSLFDLSFYEEGRYRDAAGEAFHDLSFHSAGVQSNVRDGGLKRDLSLAFEMELEDFNAVEHFASGSDAPYLEHDINYVYLFDPEAERFVTEADPSGPAIRGPTWHVLRDHYRLYKEVERSGDGFVLDSRIDGPLQPRGDHWYGRSIPHQWNMQWYIEPDDPSVRDYTITSVDGDNEPGGPIIRPTSEAVHPVVSSIRYQYSMRLREITPEYLSRIKDVTGVTPDENDTHYIEIIWDPVVTLWNPYNVALRFSGMKIRTREVPTTFEVRLAKPRNLRGGRTANDWTINNPEGGYLGANNWDIKFGDWIGRRDRRDGFVEEGLSFVIGEPGEALTLEPGELKVYSFGNQEPVPIYDYLEDFSGENTGVFFTAREGWFDSGGLAVYSTITGDLGGGGGRSGGQPQSVEIRVRTRSRSEMEYYVQGFLLSDYRNAVDARRSPNADQDQRQMFEYSGIDQQDTTFVPAADWKGPFAFTSGQFRAPRITIGDMYYYMKPALESRRPVALAQYNNPRARANPRLPNQPYKVTAPLWNFEHRRPELGQYIGPDNNGYWGDQIEGGSTHVVLFEVPTVPMSSIGSLKHANVSMRGYNPMYALGDSFGPPFLDRTSSLHRTFPNDRNNVDIYYWDQLYMMNRTLWDGYFFSTIAPRNAAAFERGLSIGEVLSEFESGAAPLPNERFSRVRGDAPLADLILGEDGSTAAIRPEAHSYSAALLLSEGSFNVNSTSVEAWKAVIGALRDETVSYLEADSGSLSVDEELGAAFSRFGLPAGDSSSLDLWRGFVRLTDEQVDQLAENIVAQVRARGPFLSLADFINRKVVEADGSPVSRGDPHALLGALQQAINDSDLLRSSRPSSVDYFQNEDFAEGDTYNGAPGNLLQSDLLVGLGPIISARSDTFRVRTYGASENEVTGEIDGEAYLEAIVQRMPEPVERAAANDPTRAEYYEPEKPGEFGRRFRVVQLRWLNKEDV